MLSKVIFFHILLCILANRISVMKARGPDYHERRQFFSNVISPSVYKSIEESSFIPNEEEVTKANEEISKFIRESHNSLLKNHLRILYKFNEELSDQMSAFNNINKFEYQARTKSSKNVENKQISHDYIMPINYSNYLENYMPPATAEDIEDAIQICTRVIDETENEMTRQNFVNLKYFFVQLSEHPRNISLNFPNL